MATPYGDGQPSALSFHGCRVLKFWHRRAARADVAGSASGAAEAAVRTAEAIVEHAWVLELVRRCDHADFAIQSVTADCDAAYADLTLAQRDGDPGRIVTAHAGLERAVQSFGDCVTAYCQVRLTVRAELDLLVRMSESHEIPGLAGHIERERSAIITQALENRSKPAERTGSGSQPPSRSRISRWLNQFAGRRVIDSTRP
jgi:hypothetical protein